MHTVELLGYAVNLAEKLGYRIRHEWLDGAGGGACVLQGHKMLFLDLAAGPGDQLDEVLRALRAEPGAANAAMPEQLRELLTPQAIAT